MMNSHFCVANGIVPLTEKGVYARVLIKKRRYLPKTFPGDLIGQNFADKEVGVVEMLKSATEDGNPFRILCFK